MNNTIFSRTWEQIQAMQMKAYTPEYIDTAKPGDYGCDPTDGGMFRMVPSGDVVDYNEMKKRLNERGGEYELATK